MPAKKTNIQDLLGKPSEEEMGMTQESADAVRTGMGLPTEGDDGTGNPLEKMDELSKQKPADKQGGSKALDSEVLNQMFMTGDNQAGMFTPEEKDEVDGVKLHEEQTDKAKAKISDKVEPKGKYKEQFKRDFLKHPDEYKIMTPEGEMTVAEAMHRGYDPLTKTFRKEHSNEEIKKKHLDKLNDADKTRLEEFTNPANAQVAPADAAKYGLREDSPMIKQPTPEAGATPAVPPMTPQAPAGPVPSLPGEQAGAPMPGPAQESTMAPGGGQDLAALLGGNV